MDRGQSLEFASLVLVLLGFFCVLGAGRWLIDESFAARQLLPAAGDLSLLRRNATGA